ncbi:MAG: hypothetical protein Udaeo2_22960 [Candidatus Udaeobacter sp.]|nr:MAG: hypothetical protein Udaeo2_22960 [Candidatus Udaeobacter sp.]
MYLLIRHQRARKTWRTPWQGRASAAASLIGGRRLLLMRSNRDFKQCDPLSVQNPPHGNGVTSVCTNTLLVQGCNPSDRLGSERTIPCASNLKDLCAGPSAADATKSASHNLRRTDWNADTAALTKIMYVTHCFRCRNSLRFSALRGQIERPLKDRPLK